MNLTHAQWLDVLCSMMEADPQPPEAIAAMRAAFNSSHTTADLKEFLHHGLYAARFHPPDARARFEALLRSKGLPPLAKLDTGFLTTCGRILKRGSIRSEEEYYVVAEILGGPEYHDLPPDQQTALGKLSEAYGKRAKKT